MEMASFEKFLVDKIKVEHKTGECGGREQGGGGGRGGGWGGPEHERELRCLSGQRSASSDKQPQQLLELESCAPAGFGRRWRQQPLEMQLEQQRRDAGGPRHTLPALLRCAPRDAAPHTTTAPLIPSTVTLCCLPVLPAGVLGDRVKVARAGSKITVSTVDVEMSKRYLKYLTKKYLKKVRPGTAWYCLPCLS